MKPSAKEELHNAIIAYKIAKVELEAAFQAFGRQFGQRRIEEGLSLRDVAAKTGFTAPYISDVELGRRRANPTLINLFEF